MSTNATNAERWTTAPAVVALRRTNQQERQPNGNRRAAAKQPEISPVDATHAADFEEEGS